MREIDITEIKKIEFEMLKYAKKICEENGIKYYLGYGTLLGAVRHKGFIPWDDDVDIVLFREEYEKFIAAVEKDHHEYIKIFHMNNASSYFGPYGMLVDTRTVMKNKKIKPEIMEGMGICIDVFPLDSFEDSETAKKYLKKSHRLKSLNNLSMTATFSGDSGVKKLLKLLVAPFANLIGHKKICEKTAALAEYANHGQKKYVMDLMWDPKVCWCISSEAYGEGTMLEFEGELFNSPTNYDLVLRSGYGDYMQFPPEEERGTGHNNIFCWKDSKGV